MKSLIWLSVAAGLAMVVGCAGPQRIQSAGTKRVFDAPFNSVWRAAMDAAQQGDLEILAADRPRGYISVRSGAEADTDEDIGVSVKSLGPSGTEVEVVGRKAGPPAVLKSWENQIIHAVGANLSRESRPVGSTGNQVYTEIHIDGESTTIVPEPRQSTSGLPAKNGNGRGLDKLKDVENRIAELRAKTREREAELQPGQDDDESEGIRSEISRLREELRIQEERLAELEKNRR